MKTVMKNDGMAPNRLRELVSAIEGADRAVELILVEYMRARQKHPSWPADAVHASAILSEEAGELTQAALDFHYGAVGAEQGRDHMMKEAAQSGAMALRFLAHLATYVPMSL
jgi:hypothetical protein